MRKLVWLLLAFVFFPSVLVAQAKGSAARPAAAPIATTPIAGTFYGGVHTGGRGIPVMTTFFVNEAGQLAGQYAMGEDTGLEMGVLSNFRTEGDYTFVADWKDKYGTGALRILFAADYGAFHGLWGDSPSDTSLRWDGARGSPQPAGMIPPAEPR